MRESILTFKEKKFVENYLENGFNGSRAYKLAYETTNNNVAKAEAWALLKKPKIQEAIESSERGYRQLSRDLEMGRRAIVEELVKIIRGDCSKDKLAGINTLARLCGDFAPTKTEVTVDYEGSMDVDLTKLTIDEMIEMRNKLLAEL